jgi:hypothetical protein
MARPRPNRRPPFRCAAGILLAVLAAVHLRVAQDPGSAASPTYAANQAELEAAIAGSIPADGPPEPVTAAP